MNNIYKAQMSIHACSHALSDLQNESVNKLFDEIIFNEKYGS